MGVTSTSSEADQAYTGPLLWLDDRPGKLSTKKHRHLVHSHVQRSYLSWKRENEHPRTSYATQRSELKQLAYRQAPPKDEPSSDTAKNHEATAYVPYSELYDAQVVKFSPHPITINMHGNSDPFNAFAVPVTPRVSQLLTFCVDVYLPSVHRDAAMPQAHVLREDWFEFEPALDDECCAYSSLTRLSRAVAPNTLQHKELAIPALHFHKQSISILKTRLRDKDAVQKPGTQVAILSLLTAANYSQNFREALFHAKILSHLIQSETITPSLRFVHYAYYYDYQRSVISASRSCFDNDIWVPEYFAEFW